VANIFGRIAQEPAYASTGRSDGHAAHGGRRFRLLPYRKEVTGGLDDTQLRTLEERLTYLRELEARQHRHPRFDPRAGQARCRAGGIDPCR
jgi:uncharacterized protein